MSGRAQTDQRTPVHEGAPDIADVAKRPEVISGRALDAGRSRNARRRLASETRLRVVDAFASARQMLTRAGADRRGVAAVEFALILPFMLMLYFGCVILSEGLTAARKTNLLARSLADLVAQTTTVNPYSTPTINYTNLQYFFQFATDVLYPYAGATTMTVSQVAFVNDTNGNCCAAKVTWSVGPAGATNLRTCANNPLQPASTNASGPTILPTALYPTTTGPLSASSYVIVADVTYQYQPGMNYQMYQWSSNANGGSGYAIKQTAYMTPRSGGAITYDTSSTGSESPTLSVSTCTFSQP